MESILLAFFGIAFVLGQLGGISIFPGVRVYALDLAIVLLVLYCALHQKAKRRLIPPLSLPILSFAAVGAVSVLINQGGVAPFGQGMGTLYLVRWLLYAALYWAAATSSIAKEVWLKVLYGGSVAIAGLGLVQYAWYPDLRNLYYLGWDPHFQRLFSTLLDPNFAGILFVCALAVGTTLLKERKWKPWIIAGHITLFVALLLTYSRSSYIALVAAGVVVALYSVRLRKILGVVAILFCAFLILLPKTGEGRNLLRTASAEARVENFQEGVSLFMGSPIVGYGFNTLRYVTRVSANLRTAADESIPSRAAAGFDMSAVFILATTGVLGLGAYLWLITRMVLLGRKQVYFMAALAAVLVHSLFVNSLFYPWVMAFLWIWAGLIPASRVAR